MIRYIVSFAILYLTFRLSKRYVEGLKKTLDLSCELVELVEFLDERMRISLAPIPQIVKNYSSPQLSACGFISAVRGGEPLSSAYKTYVGDSGVDPRLCEEISDLFSKIGKGSLELESERIAPALISLRGRVSELKEDFKKQKKLISTLSLGLSLGFIILLL